MKHLNVLFLLFQKSGQQLEMKNGSGTYKISTTLHGECFQRLLAREVLHDARVRYPKGTGGGEEGQHDTRCSKKAESSVLLSQHDVKVDGEKKIGSAFFYQLISCLESLRSERQIEF